MGQKEIAMGLLLELHGIAELGYAVAHAEDDLPNSAAYKHIMQLEADIFDIIDVISLR